MRGASQLVLEQPLPPTPRRVLEEVVAKAAREAGGAVEAPAEDAWRREPPTRTTRRSPLRVVSAAAGVFDRRPQQVVEVGRCVAWEFSVLMSS